MTLANVKERLHEYIEQADKKKLQAIYTLLENEINGERPEYDDETIALLEQRRQKFINEGQKGFSVDESIEYVKKQLKQRGL